MMSSGVVGKVNVSMSDLQQCFSVEETGVAGSLEVAGVVGSLEGVRRWVGEDAMVS